MTLRLGATASIAVAVIVGACAGGSSEPTPRPVTQTVSQATTELPSRQLLQPDQPTLFAVKPDGSDLRVLFDGGLGLGFAVSPDGTSVAITSAERDETVLYLQETATGVRQEIGRGSSIKLENWSPDGQLLAFVQQNGTSGSRLGFFDSPAAEVRFFDLPPSDYTAPHFTRLVGWAPGSEVAFLTQADSDSMRLYRVDITRSRLVELAEFEGYPPVALSPDGSHLAVGILDYHPGSSATYSIDVIEGDGSNRSELLSFSDEVPLSGGHGISWSPDGTRLAYGRLTGSPRAMSRVFVLNEDGRSVPLTQGGEGIEGSLLWSPGQDSLLVIRNICTSCDGFGQKVVLVPADGSGEVTLPGTERFWYASAAWSPDGERFAYSADALYVAEADGNDAEAIVEFPGRNYGPIVWTARDDIIFVDGPALSRVSYATRADGTSLEQLAASRDVAPNGVPVPIDWTLLPDVRVHEAVWAQDGSRVALVIGTERGLQLALRDADELRVLGTHGYVAGPRWSPNNAYIAYYADRAVWVVDEASGQSRQVVDGISQPGLAWTPDGGAILVAGEGVVRSVRADGSMPPEELFTIQAIRYGTPQVSLSPDGTAIAIGTDQGLFIGAIATGEIAKVIEHRVSGMAWSPDNDSLALGIPDGSEAVAGVYIFTPDSGALRQLTVSIARVHEVLYWLPDGRIVFVSRPSL